MHPKYKYDNVVTFSVIGLGVIILVICYFIHH